MPIITRYAGSQTASTATTATIITRVRALLNEPTASFWDDTQFLQWINDGIKKIVSDTWCIGDNETITLANNTLEYSIVNDYMTIISVQYLESAVPVKALLPGRPDMLGHISDPGEPVYWYEWDNKIGVFPLVADATDMTLNIYQVPKPTILTAGQTINIPFIYEEALVSFVIAMGLFKDNEMVTFSETMKTYEAAIAKYTREFLEKPTYSRNDVKGK